MNDDVSRKKRGDEKVKRETERKAAKKAMKSKDYAYFLRDWESSLKAKEAEWKEEDGQINEGRAAIRGEWLKGRTKELVALKDAAAGTVCAFTPLLALALGCGTSAAVSRFATPVAEEDACDDGNGAFTSGEIPPNSAAAIFSRSVSFRSS